MSNPANKPPVIRLQNVSKRFVKSLDFSEKIARKLGVNIREEVVHAVDNVSLDVEQGEVVGLAGESGCGKSTLGRMVAGILPLSDGSILYNGRDVTQLNAEEHKKYMLNIQMIFQDPFASLNPRKRIRDIIVDINRQGTSVLLIEQNANMALSIADYGYIMETGKVVMDGDPKKLLGDEDVQEFYLGLHAEGDRKSFRDIKHYKRRKRWLS